MASQFLNWRNIGLKDLAHSMQPLEGTRTCNFVTRWLGGPARATTAAAISDSKLQDARLCPVQDMVSNANANLITLCQM